MTKRKNNRTSTKAIRGIKDVYWAKFKALCAAENKTLGEKFNELIAKEVD